MPHGIWKGDINFGLVYIPVTLYSAESYRTKIKLVLLDKRDLSPIGYQKINKNTGEKVPSDQIVEGYEYEKNNYVILTKKELQEARAATLTQSIEILEFVDKQDIAPELFEKPYYLEPIKKGEHAYALLREVLRDTDKVGIAKVVIRTREYLSALMVVDKAIILQIMRFPQEIISQEDFNFPEIKSHELNKKELAIAVELVKNMTDKWQPKKYKDNYQEDLLNYIMEKIKLHGHPHKTTKTKHEKKGEVIDIMDLLKKSLEKNKTPKRTSHALKRKHS
ncbi:Ku protein [soil metagenome]